MSVRVRNRGFALWLAFACVASCGGDDDDAVVDATPPAPDAPPPDAAAPDADPCSLCTPTQDCAGTCTCPADPQVGTGSVIFDCMDTVMLAPAALGIRTYSPDGVAIHALVVGYHPTDTPLDTDIDLSAVAAGDTPFVGLGYEVDVTSRSYRGTFRSASGTLRLTSRSAADVAGTMTDVVLVEIDAEDDPPLPLPDGCTYSIATLSFDIAGAACPM